MATAPRESLKRNLLLAFVLACVILIGLIWAEGLSEAGPPTPGYYRDTYHVDESIYVTATAEAIENELRQKSGTPVPTPAENHSSGRGNH
ncbi:MAG: hypothetical protein FOGNACKC_02656 [Anaerolineae bacterium]|nr:hypothetical protein [Anaerolineae bacterium]